jgi:hypothetical protein
MSSIDLNLRTGIDIPDLESIPDPGGVGPILRADGVPFHPVEHLGAGYPAGEVAEGNLLAALVQILPGIGLAKPR